MKQINQEVNLIELTIDSGPLNRGFFLGDQETQAFLDKYRITSGYTTRYAPAVKQYGKMYLRGQTEPLREIEGGWALGSEGMIDLFFRK